MADRFQLFRLSLTRTQQPDLFGPDSDRSRSEYLTSAFAKDRSFDHYGTQFYFRPDHNRSRPDGRLGRLGREITVDENLPPEEDFLEVSHESWKACVVVIDPTDHADGQKASVQVDIRIGKPLSIFRTLVKAINEEERLAPYLITAEPIFDTSSFWEFASKNRGAITSITFEFTVPNGLWSANSSLREELNQAREHIRAQKVISTFKSEQAIDVESDQIREAVNYAGSGSGEFKAIARNNRRFNSANKSKITTIPEGQFGEESTIVKVARNIARVLGRE